MHKEIKSKNNKQHEQKTSWVLKHSRALKLFAITGMLAAPLIAITASTLPYPELQKENTDKIYESTGTSENKGQKPKKLTEIIASADRKEIRDKIKKQLENKEYKLAIAEFNEFIDHNPDDLEMIIERGRLYHHLEKFELAEKDYLKARSMGAPRINVLLGLLYYDAKKYNLAEKAIIKAKKNCVGFPKAIEAIEYILNQIDLHKDSFSYMQERGLQTLNQIRELLEKEKYSSVIKQCNEYVRQKYPVTGEELEPFNKWIMGFQDAYYLRAKALFNQGQYEKALENCEKSKSFRVRGGPSNIYDKADYLTGKIYYLQKEYALAKMILTSLVHNGWGNITIEERKDVKNMLTAINKEK